MSEPTPFDFWYAVNNTRVLQLPEQGLETFGVTRIQYHLLTESMDAVDQVRVREGTLVAAQPRILTPDHLLHGSVEGFEDEESGRFLSWLRANHPEARFVRYGFTIRKQDIQDTLLHENLETVAGNVLEHTREAGGARAVLLGVEQPWEVCLLKLMFDLVEKSAPRQIADFQSRNMLPNPHRLQQDIEAEFCAAARDPSRIPYLHKRLASLNLFEAYQDRFFALVRQSRG